MQIALLIFCFLTIVASFSAWRKSPLYSARTTLKLGGAFLLIVAVVVGASLLVLFCAGLFVLGALFTGQSLRENAIIVGGLTGFVMLLALVAYWFKRTNFDRRYRRLPAAAPEAWFGDEGLFCNGTYTPWILSGRYLLKATSASDPPPRVTLVFQSFSGTTSTLITQRIPIPDDHITDLPVLQQKLNSRCPTASVHLIAP